MTDATILVAQEILKRIIARDGATRFEDRRSSRIIRIVALLELIIKTSIALNENTVDR